MTLYEHSQYKKTLLNRAKSPLLWFFAPFLQYLCELSLLEAEPYLQYPPSMISAAAIALARVNFDFPIWTEQLEQLTDFSIDKLTDLILHLSESHCAAINSPQQAIQDKYKHSKYEHILLKQKSIYQTAF